MYSSAVSDLLGPGFGQSGLTLPLALTGAEIYLTCLQQQQQRERPATTRNGGPGECFSMGAVPPAVSEGAGAGSLVDIIVPGSLAGGCKLRRGHMTT